MSEIIISFQILYIFEFFGSLYSRLQTISIDTFYTFLLHSIILSASEEEKAEFSRKIDWLKNNIGPWSTILQYWKDTSLRRIENYADLPPTIDFTQEFPSLQHPTYGPDLVLMILSFLYIKIISAAATVVASPEKSISPEKSVSSEMSVSHEKYVSLEKRNCINQ